MKLHYKGKYDLNPESLPALEHQPGYVPFKEATDSKTIGIIANAICIVILIVSFIPLFYRYGFDLFIHASFSIGALLSILSLFPHEFLHAICFREDAYIYTNLKHGMLFVVGPETMSKGRFIFMSLLPNVLFGFIPYTIALISPQFPALAVFGALALSMGGGDYYNVFNATTQMPKGARTYLHHFNSYWYMPSEKDANKKSI